MERSGIRDLLRAHKEVETIRKRTLGDLEALALTTTPLP